MVTEVGAIEDAARIRSRQAQLYWLLGDEESSAAAMAEAQRYAERVAWPYALAELALAKAELARWSGDTEQARRQLGVAASMLGPEQAITRAVTHDLLGYLADSLDEAREHRVAAFQAASEAGLAPLIARVTRRGRGPGVARRTVRAGRTAARGQCWACADRRIVAQPDVARIEQATRRRLGEARFAEATQEGQQASWPELAEATLAG